MAQNLGKKQINISCLTKILSLLSEPKTLNYLATKILSFFVPDISAGRRSDPFEMFE